MNFPTTLENLECHTRMENFFGFKDNEADSMIESELTRKDSLFSPRSTSMTLKDFDPEP